MNTFFATFKTSFKFLWRNPVSVIILIAFPIVLILILGTALSSYISPDSDIEPFTVAAVLDDENSEFAKFLKSDDISRFFKVDFVGEEPDIGDVSLIVFEKNGEISIKKSSEFDVYAEIGITVIKSYKQIREAVNTRLSSGDYAKIADIIGKQITVTDTPLNKRVPSATDYYSVTMLVMILMYTGINGMDVFRKGLFSETGARIRTSPAPSAPHIAGLLAASTVTSYIQGMCTFLFSMFVYGAYWGDNIPLILLTLFSVVLFSQSLCIFLLMLFRNDGGANGAAQALFWIMTFVSQGYAKITFGEADKIFAYAPNALAHQIIFASAYGGDGGKIAANLCILLTISVVLFILSFILGRRKLI